MKARSLLLALTLCSVFVGAPTVLARGPAQQSREIVDQLLLSLTPQEKIEQLLIVGFQGPEVTDDVRRFILDHKIGGVFLSRETCNIVNGSLHDPTACGFPDDSDPDTPAQVARLTQGLQQAACDATQGSQDGVSYCLPLFVTIDHEGDDRPTTRLLNRFTPIPSNMTVGATFDPAQAEAVGCIIGRELSAVGVNMLLGPDLDVLDSPRSGGPGDQGIRVFGGDPNWVGEMGAAYVRGVQRCGEGRLATVAKHFPGHGRSTRWVDYEDVPVVVGKTLQALAQVDLVPFAVLAQGEPGGSGIADGIMNSHLSYPEVAGCDGGTPVAFSPTCMQAFLGLPQFAVWRQAGGLTMADDLAAGAVAAYAQEKFGTYRQADVALEALMAGNDLLPLIRPWQWQDVQPTVDYLVSRYEADANVKERVDDALRRVLTLKYRLYQGLDPAAITKTPEYSGRVGQADSAAVVAVIAEKAATIIRPAGVEELRSSVPAPVAGQRILFIECWDDPDCSTPSELGDYPPLWPRGKLAGLVSEILPGRVAAENLSTISFSELGGVLAGGGDERVTQAVQDADWLVFAFLERDPTHYPASEVLKDFLGRGRSLFDLRGKKTVVFAYNSPYHLDAGELRNVDLFVALYSKIEPSLRASLKLLFQDPAILHDGGGGSLPVDYVYGDYVLYDLSEQVKADPSQALQLAVEPEAPVAGQEFAVSLSQPVLARNGYRVANGTEVVFAFDMPDGSQREVSDAADSGIAEASLTSAQSGEVKVTVKSGDLTWSPDQPITVQGQSAESGGASGAASGEGGGVSVVLGTSVAGAVALLVVVAFVFYRRRRAPAVAPEQAVSSGGASVSPSPAGAPPASERELHVDTATHRVFVRGKEIAPPLSRDQYTLLACLYESAGKLCVRDDIIRLAWPEADSAGVSEEALDALVHRLRERLRAAGASRLLIVTVRGQGFRLDL